MKVVADTPKHVMNRPGAIRIVLFSFRALKLRFWGLSRRAIVNAVGSRKSAHRDRLHHGSVHRRASDSVKLGIPSASVISAALGLLALN